MKDKKNDFNNKYIFTLLLGAIVISATIVLFAHSSDQQLEELVRRREELEKENRRLENKAEDLAIREKRLQEDPYLIQKLAREKLGLSRPGEKRIWIKRPDNVFDSPPLDDTSPDSPTIFD